MRRAGLLTAIVVAGVTVAGVAAQQRGGGRGAGPRIPPTGTIEKIKDNLYKIGGAGSNTTVFITAEGVVLVDTKLANNGEAIMNAGADGHRQAGDDDHQHARAPGSQRQQRLLQGRAADD